MNVRLLFLAALTGCFTAQTPAERPRATTYNVLTTVGGIALALIGVEILQAGSDTDGLGPAIHAVGGGGALLGGAFMTFGGLSGVVLTQLGYTPVR